MLGKKGTGRPIISVNVAEAPAVPQAATFVGGRKGSWKVISMEAISGPPLERVQRLEVIGGLMAKVPPGAEWLLRGVTSSERYTTRREHQKLVARQPRLGRPEATYAALIPITKSASWWNLSQDERRHIFETRSGHIRTGLKFVPTIARRLYHSRDIGEPFDFLTWFEFAPSSESAFNDLVTELRKTEEWNYVEREVYIRLSRDNPLGT